MTLKEKIKSQKAEEKCDCNCTRCNSAGRPLITETQSDSLVINSWSLAIVLGVVLAVIILVQGIFTGISGLYFHNAYYAVALPYAIYSAIYFFSEKYFNPLRPVLMVLAFCLLFTPALYLALTGQVDFHTILFGDFNAGLTHMPFAWVLPYLCIAALIIPLPSRKNLSGDSSAARPSRLAHRIGQ
jgi:hypothetical protein